MVSASSSLPPKQPLAALSGRLAGQSSLPACFSLLRSKIQVSPAAVTSSKSVLVCVQNGCLVPADAAAAVSAGGPVSGFAFQKEPAAGCDVAHLLRSSHLHTVHSEEHHPHPSPPGGFGCVEFVCPSACCVGALLIPQPTPRLCPRHRAARRVK